MHTFSCSKVKPWQGSDQNQISSLTPPYLKPFRVFQVSICLAPIPLAFMCVCMYVCIASICSLLGFSLETGPFGGSMSLGTWQAPAQGSPVPLFFRNWPR